VGACVLVYFNLQARRAEQRRATRKLQR